MNKRNLPSLKALFTGCLATAMLAGCGTMSKAPELSVRERATQRWSALIANDLEKSYSYMPPSYRAATPLDRYKNGFKGGLKWTGAEVVWVKCDTDDRCEARLKIDAQLGMPRNAPPLTNYFNETWVREEGNWWLFPTP